MSTAAAFSIDLARWRRRSLAVGVVATAVCIAGALLAPDGAAQFFRAYLSAYLFYLGIGLGALVILMIFHLTGGAWGLLIRRILEAQCRTLPLLAVLFVPIACGIGWLYLWAQPDVVQHDEKLQHQALYLNPMFFWVRMAVFFCLWCGVSWLLNFWSRRQDRADDWRLSGKMLQLSGFGLVIYGITIHFSAADWIQSLQPAFHSSIFGPLLATTQLLSAMAFALVVLADCVVRPPLGNVVSSKALNDLGSLLFTFVILWAYMLWFQFMLIWIANLPVDVIWYLPRNVGGWQWVAWSIFVLNFLIPFFLLLQRTIKQNPRALAAVSKLLLAMQLVFSFYQIMPAFRTGGILDHWLDFITPLAIGGFWLAWFLWQVERWPLLAPHDLNTRAAAHARHLDDRELRARESWPMAEEKTNPADPPPAHPHEHSLPPRAETAAETEKQPEVHHADGRVEHPWIGYEKTDARFSGVVIVMGVIACVAALQFYMVLVFYRSQQNAQAELKKSPYPLAPAASAQPPLEPRLEQIDRLKGLARENVYRRELAKEAVLHSYGDTSDEGFVHIPIERAMQLVAAQLKARTDAPEAPHHDRGLITGGESNSGRLFRGEPRW